jgi:hypothetical protein
MQESLSFEYYEPPVLTDIQVTHFTCFTGTKVQILTLLEGVQPRVASLVLTLLALLVQKYKY